MLTGCPLIASDDYEIREGAGAAGATGSGGSNGGGTTGGGGGAGGTAPETDLFSCPDDLPGPALASVLTPDGDVYCMDTTEVTNGQYQEFLDAQGPFEQHAACDWNDSFVPEGESMGLMNPVVFVDWCDAYAYCAYAGKRLCGAIGGGEANYDNTTSLNDQWYFACSPDGRTYPYGNNYAGGRCNGWENNQGEPIAVGSEEGCFGAFGDIYDLSGNVIEWTDACNGNTGRDDLCRDRNSSFSFGGFESECGYSWGDRRDDTWWDVGFRCCSDGTVECKELSCLDDADLVVRYTMDEADEGQAPTQLEDSADDPLPLPISYTPGMEWVDVGGHRGLHWNAPGVDGHAGLPLDGTKIDTMLNGTARATIELVMAVEQIDNSGSRFLHVGTDDETGFFTLSTSSSGSMSFYVNTDLSHAGRWQLDATNGQRRVYHLVLDTTEAREEQQVRLYVDGWLGPWNGGSPPDVNVPIELGPGRDFVLGNRTIGQRSFQGTMFYAAVYARAMSASEVVGHAAVLLETDDAD